MTATVIAFCNQKGGTGKTTTTFQHGRAAVLAGLRTLMIDLDPQGNLTRSAAADGAVAKNATVAHALSEDSQRTLRQVIVPGMWPGLDIAPTVGESLGTVRDQITSMPLGRESRLADAIAEVADDYDLILIDCPPSLDQLTINALTAAHAAVIVVSPSLYASDGLSKVLSTIELVKKHTNPALRVGGVLINSIDERTTSDTYWAAEIQEAVDKRGLTLLPQIPKRVAIKESTEAGQGIDEYGTPEGARLAEVYAGHVATLKGALR